MESIERRLEVAEQELEFGRITIITLIACN